MARAVRAPNRKPSPPAARPAAGRSATSIIVVLVVSMAFLAWGAPALLGLAIVGFLPTFVSLVLGLMDRRSYYMTVCVGAMNAAGILPILFELLATPMTVEALTDQLLDVSSWFIMYGTAAIGALIYWLLPPVMTVYLDLKTQHEIAELKAEQGRLFEVWGRTIARPGGDDPK
ncbi:MAG: hypothetical protein QNJ92_11005 [Alphaproteobacteria bacterium]|nr:hypothetical protein [Alphaproteobacteria bacterium]